MRPWETPGDRNGGRTNPGCCQDRDEQRDQGALRDSPGNDQSNRVMKLYRAQAETPVGRPEIHCGHRRQSAVPAEDCRRRRFKHVAAHVMVSPDGGRTWRRMNEAGIQGSNEMKKQCANPGCSQTWRVEAQEDEQAQIRVGCEMADARAKLTAGPAEPEVQQE